MNFMHSYQRDILNENFLNTNKKVSFSFEFFPPKNNKKNFFLKAIKKLGTLKPKFFSVTYGANSGTKNTFDTVKKIKKITNIEVAPHLTCIDTSYDDLVSIAKEYWKNNIKHIVALRGDIFDKTKKSKLIYGKDLVLLLKKIADFEITVAAYPEMHPESQNSQSDLIYLKQKIDSGATQAITQFFFNVDNYLRFRDRCASIGINIEIIPGILPVTNYIQLKKFISFTNVKIPKWMNIIFEKSDEENRKLIGFFITIEMIRILIFEGITHFHFYTLNDSELTYSICNLLI